LGHRLPFAQRDLGFPQLGEDLFDGVTETSHTALLSARPSYRIWTRLRGEGH
jgi:hypothetical protein